jgi:hypothetical protein
VPQPTPWWRENYVIGTNDSWLLARVRSHVNRWRPDRPIRARERYHARSGATSELNSYWLMGRDSELARGGGTASTMFAPTTSRAAGRRSRAQRTCAAHVSDMSSPNTHTHHRDMTKRTKRVLGSQLVATLEGSSREFAVRPVP